ncbi:EI24 domain-containing protein [Ovoidimarina sediminis]|uniref:EI24 domain-containing protein n=1 Tax=Ovoidimarina sediminis TaxID=3079856 RepID=UPI00292FD006|nr:EI24 domain-containing protein [Rhodophyticola sp. MJ-SS7]
MIFASVSRALSQLSDPRFRRVLALGVGLTVVLLVVVYAVFLWILNWLLPESVSLPWIGEITWINDLLSGASLLLMLVLSVFLMVPVASAFTSLFLDDVADAVEAAYYPDLTPAPRIGFLQGLKDSLGFMGVIVAVNLAALILYLIFAPMAPLIFIAVNGYLLGREYFQLIALRRLGPEGARRARKRNAGTIWLAGALMAAPLTVPLLNLLVPVVGAATFTHLYHRLESASGRRNPDPAR